MSDEREMRERYERELQEARAKIEVLEKEKNERAAREQKEKESTQQETRQNPSGGNSLPHNQRALWHGEIVADRPNFLEMGTGLCSKRLRRNDGWGA